MNNYGVMLLTLFCGSANFAMGQNHPCSALNNQLTDSVYTEITHPSVASDSFKAPVIPALQPDSSQQPLMGSIVKKIKHSGSVLWRFIKAFDDYDTTYITPNKYNYSAMMQNTNTFEFLRIKSNSNDQSMTFSPNTMTCKVGPYIGWRWLFLGYTFDVGHMGKPQKTKTEFFVSLYSSLIGVDLVYRKGGEDYYLQSMSGFDPALKETYSNTLFSGIDLETKGLNIYYVFNHKHFSYPAAYSQSTVQRKSCGTFKLGLSLTRHLINFNYPELPEELQEEIDDELKFEKIKYTDTSILFGYAYNWVFARNWLYSISLSPAIGFKHNEIFKQADADEKEDTENNNTQHNTFLNIINLNKINLDFVGRMGLVWNNTRYYAGASFVGHAYTYRQRQMYYINTFANLNIYLGLYFGDRHHKHKQKKK